MSEIFDIVDEHGLPIGETVDREVAHSEGILHRTAHLWLMRKRETGVEILVQKRSANKDSYPSCYDISSAGHIPAGVDFKPSAIRELKEELGLDAKEEELHYCGTRRIRGEREFHGRMFRDNQVSNVYCIWRDIEPEECTLQEEEVEEVRWIGLEECKERVAAQDPAFCIKMEELLMLPVE